MPSFLTGIGAKLIGLGVLAAIVLGAYLRYEYVLNQRDKYQADWQSEKTALVQAQQVNQQNVAALAQIRADYARAQNAVAAATADAQSRAVQLSTIESHIHEAPKADRGRVPPVLAHVYDELLQRAPANGHGH